MKDVKSIKPESNNLDSVGKSKMVRPADSLNAVIYPFKDSTFVLHLHLSGNENYDEKKINAGVIFTHSEHGEVKRIFEDSFHCMNNLVESQDFDNDNIKDVLIMNHSGGRSNSTFHLFLVDTLTPKLTYVKGFENLPNPDLDSINNIIMSFGMAGEDVICNYYRINKKKKLVDLGHGLTTDLNDSIKRERAIKAIIKRFGK